MKTSAVYGLVLLGTITGIGLAGLFKYQDATPRPRPMPASPNLGDYVRHIDDCDDAIYDGQREKLIIAPNEEALREVWKKYVGKKYLPKIDFSKNFAGLVLYGERRTSGHLINVTEINTDEIKTNVIAEFSEPNPLTENSLTKITSPYVVIEIEKKDIDQKRHYFFLWPKKITYPCCVGDVVNE